MEKVLGVVLSWDAEKFRLFVEEARNKTKEEQAEEKFGVQGFDKVCATSAAFLMDHVNYKQNSDDYVYRVGSEKQKAACPGTYRDDVTDEFKTCKTYRFQPVTKNGRHTIELVESTVGEWKRGGEHMKSTLCVMGEGGLGKSKSAHLMGQDMCHAKGKPQYLEATAIDPLGLLSYAGELSKAALLILSDVDGKLSRGSKMTENDLKHLFLPTEAGTIQDTRYKSCKFPVGLARLFLLNGSADDIGKWFRTYGFAWIEPILRNLALGNVGAAEAFANALKDADQKAVLRRLTCCFPVGPLVKGGFLATLDENNTTQATTEADRLDAWYAARDVTMKAAED